MATDLGTERTARPMKTYSGRQIWPLDPKRFDLSIDDVAHHLSMLCRWNGACRSFYSVAQHSVYVARLMPPELQAAALLHDAAEAYVGDVVRPFKRQVWVGEAGTILRTVNEVEGVILRELFLGLAVDWPSDSQWQAIKQVDDAVMGAEARDLFDHDPDWYLHQPEVPKAAISIRPRGPVAAEEEFRDAWRMMRS